MNCDTRASFYFIPQPNNRIRHGICHNDEMMFMVDRNYKKCKLLRTVLIAATLVFTSQSAFSQNIPNDRQTDGLYGRVHIVEESNIGSRLQPDTIHVKKDTLVNVQDTQRVFLFFKKVVTRKVKRDTMAVEHVTRQVPDTIYYCRTEYTPEGYIKSRFLVKDHGRLHEQTTTTYLNNNKLEMRSYCLETGITTQCHYYYSDYGKNTQLEQVIVTKNKNNDSGELVERIEYRSEHEGETRIERHISPQGELQKELTFESGVLSDVSYGLDTNLHYMYDDNGRLVGIEVYNTDFVLIRTDRYEYTPSGIKLTHIHATKRYGQQLQPTVTTYKEEYDGAGNWTLCTIDGKETRKREIKYYSR